MNKTRGVTLLMKVAYDLLAGMLIIAFSLGMMTSVAFAADGSGSSGTAQIGGEIIGINYGSYEHISRVRNEFKNKLSYLMNNEDELRANSTQFSDISFDDEYGKEVYVLAQLGVVAGTGGGKFSPGNKITYATWMAMVTRAMFPELIENIDFSSPSIKDRLARLDQKLADMGVQKAHDPDTLLGYITRTEVYEQAFMAAGTRIYSSSLYDGQESSLIRVAYDTAKSMNYGGFEAQSGGYGRPTDYIDRDEAAAILVRFMLDGREQEMPEVADTVNLYYDDFYDLNSCFLTLSTVPKVIRDNFKADGWTLVLDDEFLDNYNQENQEEGRQKAIGLCSKTRQSIYTTNGSSIVHEFGHYLYFMLPDMRDEIENLYLTEADNLSEMSSGYCRTNDNEFFAEAFKFYIRSLSNERTRTRMINASPATYNFMVELHRNNWGLANINDETEDWNGNNFEVPDKAYNSVEELGSNIVA